MSENIEDPIDSPEENIVEKPNVDLLMVGLDEAGKTTPLYKLLKTDNNDLITIPTIGYNKETIDFEDKNYTFWDIGGLDTVRVLWKFYKENKAAVVFVIDAANRERYVQAKSFLHTVMCDEDLSNAMLLLVLNKQDKPNCATAEDMEQQLDMKSIKQPWCIVNTSAYDCQSLNNIMMNLRDLNLF
ncbi:ADP-ribosylation factor 1-like [Lucilia cuprina]|uniref:ADP-ribosylation factor 1-like n=1 Tax=Lucilia cuprina TaxID=7375 RepID=UPI001F06B67A|nr:ADP-ribosylation factor 1-like [Lucilia cuprina]